MLRKKKVGNNIYLEDGGKEGRNENKSAQDKGMSAGHLKTEIWNSRKWNTEENN